jgi:hypothetical protein
MSLSCRPHSLATCLMFPISVRFSGILSEVNILALRLAYDSAQIRLGFCRLESHRGICCHVSAGNPPSFRDVWFFHGLFNLQ